MKKCQFCGHLNPRQEARCPECGQYYSKIIESIERIAAEEAFNTWPARVQRIMQASNKKHACQQEWRYFFGTLTTQAKFTLLFIMLFVFALMVIVL